MWRKLQKHIPDVDKDDVLDLIGLESRRSTGDKLVPALAIFGAGVLVGAGLGLLFAQKPGKKLRGELRERINKGAEEVKSTVESAIRTS
ncbi:MAG: hypothetical protein DI536_21205 [Archangium gephyra]|uniref:YtxH domain-containing protein n=1 Tax=Archangium gephyra TaxID=48 RepID=A0A2W5TEM5_9BACT|nr:MAG: hypothetical protein DI536_21205 [Archangium gephyra]